MLSVLVGWPSCLVTCLVLAGAHTLAEHPASDNRGFPQPSPCVPSHMAPGHLPSSRCPVYPWVQIPLTSVPLPAHWCLISSHCSPECQEPGSSKASSLQRQKRWFCYVCSSGKKLGEIPLTHQKLHFDPDCSR